MKTRLFTLLSIALIPILITAFTGCTSETVTPPSPSPEPSTSIESPPADGQVPEGEQNIIPGVSEVVSQVKPSVVAIDVEVVTEDIFGQPSTQQGAGSGWVLSEDGYIVTNNHVVENAETVTVTLGDGRVFTAETVHTDPLTDLAVLKVDAVDLPEVTVGSSSDLQVGDWVLAIGNSLGLGISATLGIVSALDVTLSSAPGQTLLGLIQTDTAINPGNSGGPLVNINGDVVGINSIKISQVGIEGMGYAISIDEAMPIIQQLIDTGYVSRPWLGVSIYPVDPQVKQIYGLGIDHGVLVTEVVDNSPAAEAGIRAGDIITGIEAKEINDTRELLDLLTSYEIGQEIEVKYYRGDEELSAQVTLGESPETVTE